MFKQVPLAAFVVFVLLFQSGCSSTREVKRQKYAKLRTDRTFEYGFPKVWKAIENAMRNYRIIERDPEDVNEVELKRLRDRRAITDWVYARSNDKFVSYQVNGFPRKKYLQMRFKFDILAATVIGGTYVSVGMVEEIQELDEDGKSAGYTEVDDPDTHRMNHLLDRINQAILSR